MVPAEVLVSITRM